MENTNTTKLEMLSPWEALANQFRALFQKDPAIKVVFEDGTKKAIKLYVEGAEKADALEQLLPKYKILGNTRVDIVIVSANETLSESGAALFEKAFKGNGAFSGTWTSDAFISNPLTYVIFKPEVVQYWGDNLADLHGNITTLYQDLAREIFAGGNIHGANFTTEQMI